jgi:hypothetical protein
MRFPRHCYLLALQPHARTPSRDASATAIRDRLAGTQVRIRCLIKLRFQSVIEWLHAGPLSRHIAGAHRISEMGASSSAARRVAPQSGLFRFLLSRSAALANFATSLHLQRRSRAESSRYFQTAKRNLGSQTWVDDEDTAKEFERDAGPLNVEGKLLRSHTSHEACWGGWSC